MVWALPSSRAYVKCVVVAVDCIRPYYYYIKFCKQQSHRRFFIRLSALFHVLYWWTEEVSSNGKKSCMQKAGAPGSSQTSILGNTEMFWFGCLASQWDWGDEHKKRAIRLWEKISLQTYTSAARTRRRTMFYWTVCVCVPKKKRRI